LRVGIEPLEQKHDPFLLLFTQETALLEIEVGCCIGQSYRKGIVG